VGDTFFASVKEASRLRRERKFTVLYAPLMEEISVDTLHFGFVASYIERFYPDFVSQGSRQRQAPGVMILSCSALAVCDYTVLIVFG
jgi:hypothetical protein